MAPRPGCAFGSAGRREWGNRGNVAVDPHLRGLMSLFHPSDGGNLDTMGLAGGREGLISLGRWVGG